MESLDVTDEAYAQEIYRKTKCLPWTFNKVTEELRLKANRELNEPNEEETKEYVEKLRNMLIEAQCPHVESKVLLMFLRGRKFDLMRTFAFVKQNINYYLKYRGAYSDIAALWESVELAKIYKVGTVLPYRTPAGCPIVLALTKRWDPDKMSFKQAMQYTTVGGAAILENPVTQICGVVYLWDFDGLSWKHLVQAPTNISWYISQLKSNPVRVKQIHFVNINFLIHKILIFLYPLMGAKLRERVFLHGSDMTNLHKHIPPEILPEEYGGHLGPNDGYGFYDVVFKMAEPLLGSWICNKDLYRVL